MAFAASRIDGRCRASGLPNHDCAIQAMDAEAVLYYRFRGPRFGSRVLRKMRAFPGRT
jgi:hypothetical protein